MSSSLREIEAGIPAPSDKIIPDYAVSKSTAEGACARSRTAVHIYLISRSMPDSWLFHPCLKTLDKVWWRAYSF
jgi:hypothetical protein